VVAGLDEVGRGAWAGPVSVGIVVFPPDQRPPRGVRDSKQLSEETREALFPLITAWCTDWAVGHAEATECDRLGMTAALRLAAHRALGNLRTAPAAVLMDGNFDYVTPPGDGTDERLPAPHVKTVVRGDSACISIAAASIVAKVTRDRQMRALSPSFPAFDFHRNKGYPSPVHRRALDGNGLTSLHRRSWSFVEEMAFR
jgi:ribonuclease HII